MINEGTRTEAIAIIVIAGAPSRRVNRISARKLAESFCRAGANNRPMAPATSDSSAFTVSSAVSVRQIRSSSYMLIRPLFQLAFLFLYQSIQFIEQFSIAFAHSIDDAGEHRLHCFGALPE